MQFIFSGGLVCPVGQGLNTTDLGVKPNPGLRGGGKWVYEMEIETSLLQSHFTSALYAKFLVYRPSSEYVPPSAEPV